MSDNNTDHLLNLEFMKKLITLIFALCYSAHSFCLELKDLEANTIFSQLYHSQFNPQIESEQPITGVMVDESEFLATYASMRRYINANKELRFLVNIERQAIAKNEEDKYELTETSHASTASDDLFIFKREKNGHYILVSQTEEPLEIGNHGESHLNITAVNNPIVFLNPNTVGFFNEIYDIHQGITEGGLVAIVLNEDSPVVAKWVAQTAYDDTGYNESDSVVSSSKWKVLTQAPLVFGYYPIQITTKTLNNNKNPHFEIKKYVMNKDLKYKEENPH